MNPITRIWRAIKEWLFQSAETPDILIKNIEADMREKRASIDKANIANGELMGNLSRLKDQIRGQRQKEAEFKSIIEAAIQQGKDDVGASYATLLADLQGEIDENTAQFNSNKEASDNFVKAIAEGIRGLKSDAMRFDQLKAKVRLSEAQMKISQTIASSIPELEGALGGQTSQAMDKLASFAYKGQGMMDATKAVAAKLGSDIDVKVQAREMRGKALLEQFKAARAAAQSANSAAAPVTANPTGENRQKVQA